MADTESDLKVVRKATRELARKFDHEYWLPSSGPTEGPQI
jgi:hypothetical protein